MASPQESTRIVQLKVRLPGLSPMIWRRVLVPESVTLQELHGILQVGMGCHPPLLTRHCDPSSHHGNVTRSSSPVRTCRTKAPGTCRSLTPQPSGSGHDLTRHVVIRP